MKIHRLPFPEANKTAIPDLLLAVSEITQVRQSLVSWKFYVLLAAGEICSFHSGKLTASPVVQ